MQSHVRFYLFLWTAAAVVFQYGHVALAANRECTQLFQSRSVVEMATERPAWTDVLTDPTKHDPDHYRYLVHGVTNTKASLIETARFIEHGPKTGGYRLSTSLVSASRPFRLASPVGFIVEVAPENILAAHSRDINILNEWQLSPGQSQEAFDQTFREKSEQEFNERYRKRYGIKILSPSELIQRSSTNEINEVVVFNDGVFRIKIVGLYLRKDSSDVVNRHIEQITHAQDIASQLGIPLIELP